ncbi:hypothetical protein C0J52_08445 [Blattella germanica]|nr:hypothetical protein C0J52_08445 [Blattella germanica]
MHSSLKGAASEKLKELFENLTELSTLSSQLGVESALDINSIERKSRAVLEQISGLVQHRVAHDLNSMDSQEETVNVMTTTGQRDWENSLREPSKVLLTSQPSSVDNKNSRWQDMATKLARAAYEKINQKQKPPEPALLEVLPLPAANPPYPPPHPTGPKSLSKLQLIEERKSGDNIKTAIESVPCERKLQDEQCSPKKSGSALKMPSESEMESPYFSDRLLQICEKMMQELVNSIKKQVNHLLNFERPSLKTQVVASCPNFPLAA